MSQMTRFTLSDGQLPRRWYNLTADLDTPLPPPLDPQTRRPLDPAALGAFLPMPLVEQEISPDRFVEIPEPVLELYRTYRPSPLYRARRLEAALETPARIYYKFEGGSPPGSHKPNAAIPAAYYAQAGGARRVLSVTGAGQWGSAVAYACQAFDLECKVYMVRASYDQKPYRRILMETWGAEVVPSPSEDTQIGRSILEADPDSPGSLGITAAETIEEAVEHPDSVAVPGSFFNYVLMHQTIVGEEAKLQMELAGEHPDLVIGCVGAGSNYCGLALPFIRDSLAGNTATRFLAAEAAAAPTLTRGVYAYDHALPGEASPLVKYYTLGTSFVPAPIHAGGLRDYGVSPLLSYLYDQGYVEAIAYSQVPAFESAVMFARSEGIVPAPETAYAIRATIEKANEARNAGEPTVILFNFSGHGFFDLAAYERYLQGALEDFSLSEDEIRKSLAGIADLS